MMKFLRALTVSGLLFASGVALAYDSFTAGLQAEFHQTYVGYNAHAAVPIAAVPGGINGRSLSVRADFSAGAVVYAGVAAVLSGKGPGVQPFVSLGAGGALWDGALLPTVQGLIGARVPLTGGLYAVTQFQLRVGTRNGQVMPGLGIGLEYSF